MRNKTVLTLIDLQLRNRLPAVHGHEPCIVLPSAAQVQDQL